MMTKKTAMIIYEQLRVCMYTKNLRDGRQEIEVIYRILRGCRDIFQNVEEDAEASWASSLPPLPAFYLSHAETFICSDHSY